MYLIEKARVFATAAHTAVQQVRKYTGDPYIIHPKEVADLTTALTSRWGSEFVAGAEEWIAAAWWY